VSGRRIVLLGCVKQKLDRRAAAKELYTSQLWRGRRRYAERSGCPWFVVSALHGLVEPDQRLDPYNVALSNLPASERRRWGERVTEELERRLGSLAGTAVEIHAGGSYRAALNAPLRARRVAA
jgi:hypothetical protein